MTLYHTTTKEAAAAILQDGFRDATGSYMFVGITLTGVFVADYPANDNDGARGDQVLEITVPGDFDLAGFAIEEEGCPVWEWLIPAKILNGWAVRLLDEDELWNLVRPS